MIFHIGSSENLKLKIDGKKYSFNLPSLIPVTEGIKTLSKDGYILKDADGLYIILKDGDLL